MGLAEPTMKSMLSRAVPETEQGRLQGALQSLASIANVSEESRGIVITMAASSLFSGSASALLPMAKERLRQVARALLEQGDAKIIVEGHTDSRGSSEKNLELSTLRAREVRSYLVSQGIPTANIQATGLGEERPIATNETNEGRASNQRVEIVVSPTSTKSKG
jgi:OOP family OmpA-OmpF porin